VESQLRKLLLDCQCVPEMGWPMGRNKNFMTLYLNTSAGFVLLAAGLISPALAADMPAKAERGQPAPMVLGGWLVAPTLFVGAVYNSNVNQTENNKISSWGERVVPGFSASIDRGLHQTSLYGLADFQNYSASGASHKTTVDAKAGLSHAYLAQRDLTFRFNGDFMRQADVFGGTAFAAPNTPVAAAGAGGVSTPPVTVSPQVNPDRYNQYSGAASVEKRLGRAFIVLGANAISTQFDSNPAFANSRNGIVYTIQERTGFDLTPQIYAFIDPNVSWQRYTDSTRNSHGYRITGGFGTAAVGIWMGEIYGGYQAQKNDIVGTYSSGVFGARLGYSPTPMWNLRASLDETLGASSIATGGTTGVATRVTTALFNVVYNGLPRGWQTGARFGYVRTNFVNSNRNDDGWLAGANIGYEIWRNLGMTLDYQYKSVNSNVALQSFNQHMVSLGVSYKY
jgi:hypothetical protein